jgi:hypothetical protein
MNIVTKWELPLGILVLFFQLVCKVDMKLSFIAQKKKIKVGGR